MTFGNHVYVFIFKATTPTGRGPCPSPTALCEAETLRGDAELNTITSKLSPHTHQPASNTNLIYCYKLLHSNMVDI